MKSTHTNTHIHTHTHSRSQFKNANGMRRRLMKTIIAAFA